MRNVMTVLQPIALALFVSVAGVGAAQAGVTANAVPAVYSDVAHVSVVQAHHRLGRGHSHRSARRFNRSSRYYYSPRHRYAKRRGFAYRPYYYRPYGSRARSYYAYRY